MEDCAQAGFRAHHRPAPLHFRQDRGQLWYRSQQHSGQDRQVPPGYAAVAAVTSQRGLQRQGRLHGPTPLQGHVPISEQPGGRVSHHRRPKNPAILTIDPPGPAVPQAGHSPA
jgi:hypothetical protein